MSIVTPIGCPSSDTVATVHLPTGSTELGACVKTGAAAAMSSPSAQILANIDTPPGAGDAAPVALTEMIRQRCPRAQLIHVIAMLTTNHSLSSRLSVALYPWAARGPE